MDKKKKLLIISLVSLVLIIIAAGAMMKYSTRPDFCTNCHEIKPAVASWQASNHSTYGAECMDCHADKGELNLIKKKIGSLKEIYIHLTNTPDPMEIKGNVPNSRCLDCHSGKPDGKRKATDVTKFTGEKGKIHNDSNAKCASCHIQSIHGNKAATSAKVTIAESDKCVACHTDVNKVAALSAPIKPAAPGATG